MKNLASIFSMPQLLTNIHDPSYLFSANDYILIYLLITISPITKYPKVVLHVNIILLSL